MNILDEHFRYEVGKIENPSPTERDEKINELVEAVNVQGKAIAGLIKVVDLLTTILKNDMMPPPKEG